jgi:hypothetical protein
VSVERNLFELTADLLERHTGLDRLEARGALRLALKDAGLHSEALGRREIDAVLRKLMPERLARMGVPDAASVCERALGEIARAAARAGSAPDANRDRIFRRLGGD